ncbi:O-antigen ligase family protein, partial [Vibrio genomosp. F10]
MEQIIQLLSSCHFMLKSLSRHLLHLPLLWLAAGIIWLPQGNKPMVAIVLIVVLFYVFGHGLSDIKRNFQSSYWLGGILISAGFVGVSYLTCGASSQEFRGLLLALVYLSVLPKDFMSAKNAQILVVVAAIASFLLSIWYFLIVPTDRMLWPTNPIPLAAHQGLVSLLSLGLLLTSFDGKKPWLLSLAAVLSGFSMLPTQSRGVILGVFVLIAISLLILFVQRKIAKRYLVFALFVTLGCFWGAKEPVLD